MTAREYWVECIDQAACECGLVMTAEQRDCLAESTEIGHENYGMAFYSPTGADRIAEITREWESKLARAEVDKDRAEKNADAAIKKALRLRPGDCVSIGEYGEVLRHGGRTERIQ